KTNQLYKISVDTIDHDSIFPLLPRLQASLIFKNHNALSKGAFFLCKLCSLLCQLYEIVPHSNFYVPLCNTTDVKNLIYAQGDHWHLPCNYYGGKTSKFDW